MWITLREIHFSNSDWKFSVKSCGLKENAVLGYSKEFVHCYTVKEKFLWFKGISWFFLSLNLRNKCLRSYIVHT